MSGDGDGQLFEKPVRPLDSDCCGSGCVPCVFDIYEQDLARWKQECLNIQLRESNRSPILTGLSNVFVPHEYRSFKIKSIEKVTDDSSIFTLRCSSYKILPGQHFVFRIKDNENKWLKRQYTPLNLNSEEDLKFLIKFYSDGAMSSSLFKLTNDDFIEIRGAIGTFKYISNKYKLVVMLSAGTGVAPMLQVSQAITDDPDDETMVKLVYTNKRYKDIAPKSQLEELAFYWNFTVLYNLTLDRPGNFTPKYNEEFLYGRLQCSDLKKIIGATVALDDVLILTCGPKSFDKDMIKYSMNIGLSEDNIFKF